MLHLCDIMKKKERIYVMNLPYNGKNKPIARALRKNATRHENHLWYDFLHSYPVKFRRQQMIDDYIADFYCKEARLVVEVDGSQHYTDEGIEKDRYRTERLERYNLTVIRITNQQVDKDFYGVCLYIDQVIKELLSR